MGKNLIAKAKFVGKKKPKSRPHTPVIVVQDHCLISTRTALTLRPTLRTPTPPVMHRANISPSPKPRHLRVLFLDIDGVMLPFGDQLPPVMASPNGFGIEAMHSLSAILDACADVVLVLSSTWRCAGGEKDVIAEFAFYTLHYNPASRLGGIVELGSFLFTTDKLMHTHRQWEIAAWLKTAGTNERQRFVIDAWLVLDDEELGPLIPPP